METEAEADVVTSPTGTNTRRSGPEVAGTVALVLGVLFGAAVAFTYVLSLSDTVDPPDWLRIVGLVWLPVGLVGIPLAYTVARTGEGRGRGRVGVVIAIAGLVAFVALVVAIG